jgi:hypothetical protein
MYYLELTSSAVRAISIPPHHRILARHCTFTTLPATRMSISAVLTLLTHSVRAKSTRLHLSLTMQGARYVSYTN